MSTTGGSGFQCSYCGCWHNYSYEMCRDITRNRRETIIERYIPIINIDRHTLEFAEMEQENTKLKEQLKRAITIAELLNVDEVCADTYWDMIKELQQMKGEIKE